MTSDQMADQLLARLEDINMSQAEFARRAGVSEKHVSRVLIKKATAPTATLDYWAFVLGMHWSVKLEEGRG